jgi:LmbE family N-acetylglucosaminyl deacetylase
LDRFPDDWSRALCVVAHPDDLEYGAAAAIATWTAAGKEVSYLLVTRGEAGIDGMDPVETARVREAEERAGAAVVGVDTVEFLDGYVDGVIEYGLPLRRDLAQAIRRTRPDLLVSINFRETWGGRSFNMADHRNVGLALLDAARDAGNRWVFIDSASDAASDTAAWSGVRWAAFGGSPTPTHFVDVSRHLDRGIESLRAHAAYIDGLGGEFDVDAFLRGTASTAGAAAGCTYAASFEVFEL